VDTPHIHEPGRVPSHVTSGGQHADSTTSSLHSGHQWNPPSQFWSSAHTSTQAPVAAHSPLLDTGLIQRQRTTALGTSAAGHHCSNHLDTTSTPSYNQPGVAASDTTGHHTPHELPFLREVMEQPEVVLQPPALLSLPTSMVSSYPARDMQSLQPQCQPAAELPGQQGAAGESASSRLPPNGNKRMHTTSYAAGAALLQPRVADRPASQVFHPTHAPTSLPAHQVYAAGGADGYAWDGTFYNSSNDVFGFSWNASFGV
jgi:hypothetical protein